MERKLPELGPLQRFIVDLAVKLLVKDSPDYRQHWPNDIEALRSVLKPGDVILVEGKQRVSKVIKYLTQSSWSHAALYIGDFLHRTSQDGPEHLERRFGDDAKHLLIEANMDEGVTSNPLSKYRDYNIRICRPVNLHKDDLQRVVESVCGQLGTPYSVRQIFGLLRYYFPISFMPRRFQMTGFNPSGSRETIICSSQIAMAFQSIRYPIQPLVVAEKRAERRKGLLALIRNRRPGVLDTRIFSPCDPMLVTPRDFDLSPYFEIVKHSVSEATSFNYRDIHWHTPSGVAEEEGADIASAIDEPPVVAPVMMSTVADEIV
jgi:hypothetical protein